MKRLSTFRLTFILILLALIAVSALFGVKAYSDYHDEDKLADEVQAAELQIARLAQLHDIDTLTAELASLEAQLGDTLFPPYVENDKVNDLVDESAATANVAIESWAINDVSTQAIDGSAHKYRVYSYEVTASGKLSDIFTFLAEIEENAPYETMKLDEVELTQDEDTGNWSMSFSILVFAQPSV